MHAPIIAVMTLMASAGIAAAADMPNYIKAPPQFQRAYDWTGFYVGANAGGGWSNANSAFSVAGIQFASVDNSLLGAIGGVQAGYNWQSGATVFGVEADFQFSGMKGGLDAPCPALICLGSFASFDQKIPWFGTVRGRLGYASDGWLIYATGGYAYARVETDASAGVGPLLASLSRSETRSGWTAGAGIEVALAQNWTARIEYLYVDLGTHDGTWTIPGLPPLGDSTKVFTNVARGGLNYKF